MNRLTLTATPLAGVMVVERARLADSRGFLERMFCARELHPAGWTEAISQINHTFTQECGTVRGLHFQQTPCAERKLVSCLLGEVWDVAIDLRADSPTFLHWHAERLSADNRRSLLIPPGFAHGFQTLSANVHLVYCHSLAYSPAHDCGLHPEDPRLAIDWPLPVKGLSPRDSSHPYIGPDFLGVVP